MKRQYQYGNTTVTILILVAGLIFVLACYNPDKVPDRLRGALPDHQSQNNQGDDFDSDSQQSSSGIYTVQVLATPDREEAYAYQRALVRDGYSARVESSKYGREGIYYKVRIGRYYKKGEAIGVKDRIRRVYIKHFNDSFVYRY